MASYYIDYENVHNEGLKGVHNLKAEDKLCLFYSNKADTLKIDVVRQLMECEASIRFEKIVNGVENALDFQLITALMCNYVADENYYIISRDRGYDAAIEMAYKQGRTNLYRCRDIDGAIKHQIGLGIDESAEDDIIVELDLTAPSEEPETEAEPEITSEDVSFGVEQAEEKEEPAEFIDSAEADDIPFDTNEQEDLEVNLFAAEDNVEEGITAQPDESQVEEAVAVPEVQAENESEEAEDVENAEEEEQENGEVQDDIVAAEELQRRARQSICTKILNNVKLIHKIPITYKQAGTIYEALSESDSKMQFYHKLLQLLGRKKGRDFYQQVKGTYKSVSGIYKASLTAAADDNGENASAAEAVDVEENVGAQVETVAEADLQAEVDNIKNAFEEAEQNQTSPGESIMQMVELVKNI